jgi:hypothetical protein
MRRAFFLGIALALAGCGGLVRHDAGAATQPAATTRPVPPKSFVDQPDLLRIPDNVPVRGFALSWDELIAAEKPDLVIRPPGYVDGHDLLWLERGPKGELAFRLARAFLFKPKADTTCWVAFAPPTGERWWESDLATELIDTHITATKDQPHADAPLNYAVPLATDPVAGTIYEIGWISRNGRGSGMCFEQRNLYLWQHADGTWQFVGEGEGTGSSHSSWEGSGVDLASSAAFLGKPAVPRIVLAYHDTSYECGESQKGVASITEERDYVLTPGEGGEPGLPQLVGQKLYTATVEGDTLDTLARRVAMRDMESNLTQVNPHWHLAAKEPLTEGQLAENTAELRKARAMLERMNAGIGSGPVKPGDKVLVSRRLEE